MEAWAPDSNTPRDQRVQGEFFFFLSGGTKVGASCVSVWYDVMHPGRGASPHITHTHTTSHHCVRSSFCRLGRCMASASTPCRNHPPGLTALAPAAAAAASAAAAAAAGHDVHVPRH